MGVVKEQLNYRKSGSFVFSPSSYRKERRLVILSERTERARAKDLLLGMRGTRVEAKSPP